MSRHYSHIKGREGTVLIKEISISGFRGFGKTQTVQFAIPNEEKRGSGLTIITGPNNSGKTTIIEALRAFNGNESPSFSEGRRNVKTDGIVNLTITDDEEKSATIKSIPGGGSSTGKSETKFQIYILQSRRSVPFEFGRTDWDRDQYISYSQRFGNQRTASLDNFDARIFQIEKKKSDFDVLIKQILGSDFCWTIEQRDSGKYYIKYISGGVAHSSEGVGDGIWSIFTICAALFDAPEKSTIVIDEPELSVHPALQKRLMELLLEYSKTRQIVISTHSPYFINWEAIINGAKLLRIVKESGDSTCYQMSEGCRGLFTGIMRDLNNPHTLGLEANEVFFLEDKIILVEGQEDVVIFNRICNQLGKDLQGNFYGWGVGGAPKMRAFLMLFQDMGYKHVVSILDGDQKELSNELRTEFSKPEYMFLVLPTDDIRDKKGQRLPEKEGIATEKGKLKNEYEQDINRLFDNINAYFNSKSKF